MLWSDGEVRWRMLQAFRPMSHLYISETQAASMDHTVIEVLSQYCYIHSVSRDLFRVQYCGEVTNNS